MATKTDEYHDLEVDTLAGDVRDALIASIRQLKRPWTALAESEQRELVERMERTATNLVQQAMTLTSDYDYPKTPVQLGEIKIVGGDRARIEAKIAASNIEQHRNVLGDHAGGRALLVMVDPEVFMGERAPGEEQVTPDQMDLPGDDAGAG